MRGSKCTRTSIWFVNINRNRQLTNLAPKRNGTANLAMNHGNIQHTDHQAFGAAASIPTSSKAELAMFHHQTLGPLPLSTITKAAKNDQLRTFPGLTTDLLTKHLTLSTATTKGHLVRPRQGINSTRKDWQATMDARLQVGDMNPAEEMYTVINNEVFCFAALADTIKGTIYSDLTGGFPLQSYAGMQYIFIAYI